MKLCSQDGGNTVNYAPRVEVHYCKLCSQDRGNTLMLCFQNGGNIVNHVTRMEVTCELCSQD